LQQIKGHGESEDDPSGNPRVTRSDRQFFVDEAMAPRSDTQQRSNREQLVAEIGERSRSIPEECAGDDEL
jgi:hypothetical protein